MVYEPKYYNNLILTAGNFFTPNAKREGMLKDIESKPSLQETRTLDKTKPIITDETGTINFN